MTTRDRDAWEIEFCRRLGANITTARLAKGWSGYDLAAAVEIHPSVLWRYEDGRPGIGLDLLQTIADALGVTSTSLLPRKLNGMLDA